MLCGDDRAPARHRHYHLPDPQRADRRSFRCHRKRDTRKKPLVRSVWQQSALMSWGIGFGSVMWPRPLSRPYPAESARTRQKGRPRSTVWLTSLLLGRSGHVLRFPAITTDASNAQPLLPRSHPGKAIVLSKIRLGCLAFKQIKFPPGGLCFTRSCPVRREHVDSAARPLPFPPPPSHRTWVCGCAAVWAHAQARILSTPSCSATRTRRPVREVQRQQKVRRPHSR